ncbi:MAG: DUF481 domain-containing protein, partial [Gemmatimonadota bacterium]
MDSKGSRLALVVLMAAAAPRAASAQGTPPTGLFNTAELTAVWTAGNSPASTFGVKYELRKVWASATFKLEAGGLRTESNKRIRAATGSETDYDIAETNVSAVTAENYALRGRYDRKFSSKGFLFGSVGWTRNTFSGINSRYSFVTGAGNAWVDREGARFKTDYGITYTIQNEVVDDPDKPDAFGGLRVSVEAAKDLTSTTTYNGNLIVDENLQETDDIRADFTNSIRVSINSNLALKT